MHLPEGVQHREGVGDHGCVVVLLVEDRRAVKQVVERVEESRAALRASRVWHRLAEQRKPVLVVVLIRSAGYRQPVLLVLDVAPEEVAEGPQRIDRQVRDRKSTRLNSSHMSISYAVFCLKKKNN